MKEYYRFTHILLRKGLGVTYNVTVRLPSLEIIVWILLKVESKDKYWLMRSYSG